MAVYKRGRLWQRAKLESARSSPFPLSPSLCEKPNHPGLLRSSGRPPHQLRGPGERASRCGPARAVISGFVAKSRAVEYAVSNTKRL